MNELEVKIGLRTLSHKLTLPVVVIGRLVGRAFLCKVLVLFPFQGTKMTLEIDLIGLKDVLINNM
jgi:hypothetical protein